MHPVLIGLIQRRLLTSTLNCCHCAEKPILRACWDWAPNHAFLSVWKVPTGFRRNLACYIPLEVINIWTPAHRKAFSGVRGGGQNIQSKFTTARHNYWPMAENTVWVWHWSFVTAEWPALTDCNFGNFWLKTQIKKHDLESVITRAIITKTIKRAEMYFLPKRSWSCYCDRNTEQICTVIYKAVQKVIPLF